MFPGILVSTATLVWKLTFKSVALIVSKLSLVSRRTLDRMEREFREEMISWAIEISFVSVSFSHEKCIDYSFNHLLSS